MNDYKEALEHAVKLLKASDRLEAEVRSALTKRGYEGQSVQNVVSFLIERKLLNDKRTIQNLIEKKSGKRSVGIEKLRAELLERGAPEELVEDCLAEMPRDETSLALEALSSKFISGGSRAKAGRFLMSRGFSEETAEAALDGFFPSDDFPE